MSGDDTCPEIDYDKAPFRFYEVVEMHPLDFETEPDVVDLVGKRGAITGMAFDDAGWAFSVAIQSGGNWYFGEAELKSTGIVLSPLLLYGEFDKAEYARIRVDALTGETTCVAGNADFLQRGPTALSIKLDDLKAEL